MTLAPKVNISGISDDTIVNIERYHASTLCRRVRISLFYEISGAACVTRTRDPRITNDRGWTPTCLITQCFFVRQILVARMLQESWRVPLA